MLSLKLRVIYSGLIIGWFTDFFTSNAHCPVQHLAEACKSGAAINMYSWSCTRLFIMQPITILAIAATIYASFKLAGM